MTLINVSAFKLDNRFEFLFDLQVQAVLLLLGGYEVPTGIPTVGMPSQNQNQRVCIINAVTALSLGMYFALIIWTLIGFKWPSCKGKSTATGCFSDSIQGEEERQVFWQENSLRSAERSSNQVINPQYDPHISLYPSDVSLIHYKCTYIRYIGTIKMKLQ